MIYQIDVEEFSDKEKLLLFLFQELKITFKKLTNYIIIPDAKNSITEKDIEKNTIRITSNFKDFFCFNNEKENLIVVVGNIEYKGNYTKRDRRSDLFKFHKDAFLKLELNTGKKLKIIKLSKNKFELITI